MRPALFLASLALVACSAPAAPPRAEACTLHGATLVEQAVAVQYGLPLEPPDAEQAAREQLFPNALRIPQGGCVVRDETATVRHCPACTERQQAWMAARDIERLIRDAERPAPLESSRTRP